MVNTDDFIKRLEILLDYYGLSASSFADRIGVQRSSLSHLLSGRNKPSLDLILKIVSEFPDIDLYWILNGKGIFPKLEIDNTIQNNTSTPPNITEEELKTNKPQDLFSDDSTEVKNRMNEISKEFFSDTRILEPLKNESEIDQIVIFYKDGTYSTYKQRPQS